MRRELVYHMDEQWTGKELAGFLKRSGYTENILTHLRNHDGAVTRNGTVCRLDCSPEAGDEIRVVLEDRTVSDIPAVDCGLGVVYEDEDIMLIDKPCGMPAHPSSSNKTHTVANGVMYLWNEEGSDGVFRCIDRLDRDTTGLTVIAKNMLSAALLSTQLKEGRIKKTYLALVQGRPSEDTGTIDLPISRVEGDSMRRCPDPENGQKAVTHYEVIKSGKRYSLLKIRLETGRTHQIRVHMKAIGHPLPGDSLYETDMTDIKRHALHAWRVELDHPVTGEHMVFEAPLPEDMAAIAAGLE